jgi:hypothetical protein
MGAFVQPCSIAPHRIAFFDHNPVPFLSLTNSAHNISHSQIASSKHQGYPETMSTETKEATNLFTTAETKFVHAVLRNMEGGIKACS